MANKVKMTAVDTMHISAVSPNNIGPGEEFEIDRSFADDLEKRGLATRVDSKSEPEPEVKKEAPPANKAEVAPSNKGEAPPISSAEPKGK